MAGREGDVEIGFGRRAALLFVCFQDSVVAYYFLLSSVVSELAAAASSLSMVWEQYTRLN
jgi:hypothetical protein